MEQADTRDTWLALVQRQVESLEYGVVQIERPENVILSRAQLAF